MKSHRDDEFVKAVSLLILKLSFFSSFNESISIINENIILREKQTVKGGTPEIKDSQLSKASLVVWECN